MHKDIKNKKFGRLTPIEYIPGHNIMRSAWLCKCDCGNETIVSTDKIVNQWNSITEAATELNVSRMAVIKWIRHDVKSRKYKNYTFKLVKE